MGIFVTVLVGIMEGVDRYANYVGEDEITTIWNWKVYVS
jgi:hypothetical protein